MQYSLCKLIISITKVPIHDRKEYMDYQFPSTYSLQQPNFGSKYFLQPNILYHFLSSIQQSFKKITTYKKMFSLSMLYILNQHQNLYHLHHLYVFLDFSFHSAKDHHKLFKNFCLSKNQINIAFNQDNCWAII